MAGHAAEFTAALKAAAGREAHGLKTDEHRIICAGRSGHRRAMAGGAEIERVPGIGPCYCRPDLRGGPFSGCRSSMSLARAVAPFARYAGNQGARIRPVVLRPAHTRRMTVEAPERSLRLKRKSQPRLRRGCRRSRVPHGSRTMPGGTVKGDAVLEPLAAEQAYRSDRLAARSEGPEQRSLHAPFSLPDHDPPGSILVPHAGPLLKRTLIQQRFKAARRAQGAGMPGLQLLPLRRMAGSARLAPNEAAAGHAEQRRCRRQYEQYPHGPQYMRPASVPPRMVGMRWAPFVLAATAAAADLAGVERLAAAGRVREALAQLERSPDRSAQWHLLASKLYDALGDPKQAVAEAENGLRIEPRNEALHLQLGSIFLGHNTPAAAAEIFTEALRLLPDSVLLRLGRGIAYKELQQYEQAERDLKPVLERQPGSGVAFDALGTVYLQSFRLGDLKTAAEAFLRHAPADYRGPYFLAAALEGQDGNTAEIEKHLRESIRLNARFAAAHALLGKVLLRAGRTEEAVPALEAATRLRPDYTPAHMNLGTAYRKLGRNDDAKRAFDSVKALNQKEREGKPALRYGRGRAETLPRPAQN